MTAPTDVSPVPAELVVTSVATPAVSDSVAEVIGMPTMRSLTEAK